MYRYARFERKIVVVGLLLIAAGLLGSLSGCTSLSMEAQHVSHPLAGPPFGPITDEDSLDAINACAQRETKKWYVEQCIGYVYTDGGFYGPKLIWQGRFGRKWKLRN